MKSPFYFIAKPIQGKRYDNTKKLGDIDLLVSTSEEDHLFSTRIAVVVSAPISYRGPVEINDWLLVHHNVFKYYNDMQGRKRSGKTYFKEDLFFIEHDQFYMYKKKGDWQTHDRYCFVEPISPQDSFVKKPLKEEPLMGKIKYVNKTLKDLGVKKNDLVGFKPDSEYEFRVDGKKLYRMYDHQITMVL